MKQGKSFSEIKVGDSDQFEVFVDEKMHSDFSELFGDFSPIHTSTEFSSKSRFKRRIGYAFLLTGFLSRLYGEHLPGGKLSLHQTGGQVRQTILPWRQSKSKG